MIDFVRRILVVTVVLVVFWRVMGLHPIAFYLAKWKLRNAEESEFGSGRVVCLVKFMAHMNDRSSWRVRNAHRWMELTEGARQIHVNNAIRYPKGDDAKFVSDAMSVFMGRGDFSMEKDLSLAIELWMNAASDHFYGLNRGMGCPRALIKLADYTLGIGHGFKHNVVYKYSEVEAEIWRLVEEASLELDRNLDVVGDWGQWS